MFADNLHFSRLRVPAALFVVATLLPRATYSQYTLDDIAQHGANDDCWTSVYGEVFDITVYAPDHPNPTVYVMCGKDGTAAFDGVHGDNPQYMDIFPGIDYLGTLVEGTSSPTGSPKTAVPNSTASTVDPTATVLTDAPTSLATAFASTANPTSASTLVDTTEASTMLPATQTPDRALSGTTTNPSASPVTSSPTITVPQSEVYETIAFVELSSHNNDTDCWTGLHQNVYEFTSFLRLHPGGSDILSPCCGKDCTYKFNEQHDLRILDLYGSYYLVGPLERSFTVAELSHSNTSENCLVSFFRRVFNVTAYADSQPLADYAVSKTTTVDTSNVPCGTEITMEQFRALSPGMTEFYVGALVEDDADNDSNKEDEGASNNTSAMGTMTFTLGPNPPPPSRETGPGNATDDNGVVTATQLAAHASERDCWSVYFGVVYDMTMYSHPGARSFITEQCGKDGTASFLAVLHPENYMSMINEYRVGPYLPPPPTDPPTAPPPTEVPVSPPASNGDSASEKAPITLDELALHSSAGDCWTVYYSDVYDMTTYVHPGGSDFITAQCGQDGSNAFGAVHPQSYLSMITPFRLGALSSSPGGGDTSTPAPTDPPTDAPTDAPVEAIATTTTGGPISALELSVHSSPGDCWTVYFSEVYDMSSYNHPGGSSFIVPQCGQDGTSSFSGIHPQTYTNMVSHLKLGPLDGTAPEQVPEPVTPEPVAAVEPAPAPSGSITMEELGLHSSSNDCWVAYFDEVYDVTSYAPSHPGGPDLVTMSCGQDGTGPFSGVHGRGTLDIISASFIGTLEGGGGGGGGGGGYGNGNGGNNGNGGGGGNGNGNGGHHESEDDEEEEYDGEEEYYYYEEDEDDED